MITLSAALLIISKIMACQNFTKHNRNRFVVTGISLTEMLVAVMLLSLVTGFAFHRHIHTGKASQTGDRISAGDAPICPDDGHGLCGLRIQNDSIIPPDDHAATQFDATDWMNVCRVSISISS